MAENLRRMRMRNKQDAVHAEGRVSVRATPLQCLQPAPCRTLSSFLWEFEAIQEGNGMVVHTASQPKAWTFLRAVLCPPEPPKYGEAD